MHDILYILGVCDIMEAVLVRLAQMSRAVGIHVVISTVRPSANVITGLMKANIPARIALQVASQIDSRTILDTGGAEKLLGAGDMLYLSAEMANPARLQAPYINDEEINALVKKRIKKYPETEEVIFTTVIEDDEFQDDNLYEEAKEFVIETRKVSTSYLQRKLSIGYSRAARIVDMLEERGVIGPVKGSKSREMYEK